MKKILLLAVCVAALTGCRSDRERRIETIRDNDTKLFQDTLHSVNRPVAEAQVNAYREFAEDYPSDSLAPDYLFKGADLANGLGQGAEAVAMLQTLRKAYPSHPKAGTALFMIAFFYETTLHNAAKAQEGYSEFLRLYPDHQLAQAAEFSLLQLKQGMSAEDVVKMFEARNDTAHSQ